MPLTIHVKDADGVSKNSIPEHVILEFQGKFSTMYDVNLGKLILEDDKAWFNTGNQLMEGRIIALEQPVYVMSKDREQDHIKSLVRVAKVSKRILFDREPDIISHDQHIQQ